MRAAAVMIAALGIAAAAPSYDDKLDLSFYIDEAGERRPIMSVADWEIRRAHLIENFHLVAGSMPDDSARVPLDMRVESEEVLPDYTRMKITFAVEANDRLTAWLLIPANRPSKAPAMLCPHPTHDRGKDVVVGLTERENRSYAAELAARGYVTLAPDYPGFGEYKVNVYEMGYASATAKGIWNHMRCVDLLQSLPEVDPGRIGAIGHSLGGHNTLFAGLFDARIKVMVTSCGFTRFAKYYDGDLTGWSHKGYMPRIADVYDKNPARMPFDFPDLIAALAPRAVFISAPVNDDNFEVSGVRESVEAARSIFEMYGAPGNLRVLYPDSAHDFPDDARQAAYEFINVYLNQSHP